MSNFKAKYFKPSKSSGSCFIMITLNVFIWLIVSNWAKLQIILLKVILFVVCRLSSWFILVSLYQSHYFYHFTIKPEFCQLKNDSFNEPQKASCKSISFSFFILFHCPLNINNPFNQPLHYHTINQIVDIRSRFSLIFYSIEKH